VADVERLYGIELKAVHVKKESKQGITLEIDPSYALEEYKLDISGDKISIFGSKSGVFYALQTLLQLAEIKDGDLLFPCVHIEDSPRFGYRGAMLDVGRYYYKPEEIKQFIDHMSRFKLNRFHWHLTEDAGWRIEIKKYPLLTDIGAWRNRTMTCMNPDMFDNLPHGGFYTQEEIRDIVAYAAARNIEIIPEIDMPGHILSAIAAYPHLSCRGEKIRVLDRWQIQEDILCAGNEDVYDFIEDVMDELLELFPSKVIHVGGDEAPTTRWEKCPKCQARIAAEGMTGEHDLQIYFERRVGEYLASKGRRMLAWDDCIVPGSIPSAMVMRWHDAEGGVEFAAAGHDVVMSPTDFMYFDYFQGQRQNEPFGFGNYLPLAKTYDFEPVPRELPAQYHDRIIGVQGNVWCEFIHAQEHLEYMIFPRFLALSEVGWSSSEKNFNDFYGRIGKSLQMLDGDGGNMRIPEPLGLEDTRVAADRMTVSLTPVRGARIIYTIDGTEPLDSGVYYEKPIELDLSNGDVTLKCNVKMASGRVSRTYTAVYGKDNL
jgi:hexosaminidase